MSAIPSPAPSLPPPSATHFIHHPSTASAAPPPSAHPPPPHPPVPSASGRQKSKAYSSTVAATAEDVKYEAKYKDLKRKVKEIEMDNDKLKVKSLAAKRQISRLKLERAILYERITTLSRHAPGAVNPTDQAKIIHPDAPPHPHSFDHPSPRTHHSQRQAQIQQQPRAPYYQAVDPNNPSVVEWARDHGGIRTAFGHEGPVQVVDISTTGAPVPPPSVHHVDRLPPHIPEVSADKYLEIPRRGHAGQIALEQVHHPPPPTYSSGSAREPAAHHQHPQHMSPEMYERSHRRQSHSSTGEPRPQHRDHREPAYNSNQHPASRTSRPSRAHAQPPLPPEPRDHGPQALPSVHAILNHPEHMEGRLHHEMHDYPNPPPPPQHPMAHHPSHSPSSVPHRPPAVRRSHEGRPIPEEVDRDREQWEWEKRERERGRPEEHRRFRETTTAREHLDHRLLYEREMAERDRQMHDQRDHERALREHESLPPRRMPTPPYRYQEPASRERERERERDQQHLPPMAPSSSSRAYRDDPLPPPPPAPPQHIEMSYSNSGSRTNTPGTHASGGRSRRSRADSYSREYGEREREDLRPEYGQMVFDTPHMPASVDREGPSVRGGYRDAPGSSSHGHHPVKRSRPDEDEEMAGSGR